MYWLTRAAKLGQDGISVGCDPVPGSDLQNASAVFRDRSALLAVEGVTAAVPIVPADSGSCGPL